MAIERALKFYIVGTMLPIAPKIDLVLDEDGLAVVEDIEEMTQSIARLPLAQLGDSIFYPKRGVPWLKPRVGSALPVLGSGNDPYTLARIEYAVGRALNRDRRVVSANVTTSYNDNSRTLSIYCTVDVYDDRFFDASGLLELEFNSQLG